MTTEPAPDGRTITFLVPDGSGHSTLVLEPGAAADKFSQLRGEGFALFDVTTAEEPTLVVDAGALPGRMLAVTAYEGG
jgi:hypothetical protein